MFEKIKQNAVCTLNFLRLIDDKQVLSLTNITMILIIYKIAVTPVMSFQDITALALGVLGYQAKRLIEKEK